MNSGKKNKKLTPIEQFQLSNAIAECYTDEYRVREQFGKALYMPTQTHSCNIAIVNEDVTTYPDTDALISLNEKNILGIRTADCIPVLVYAKNINAIAAIHAGWRGTLSEIVKHTGLKLTAMGANPEQMYAAIMPGICEKCYEVSSELYLQFHPDRRLEKENPHLNLPEINREQLLAIGIPPKNITTSNLCTMHSRKVSLNTANPLHSYRYNATNLRNISLIYLPESIKVAALENID